MLIASYVPPSLSTSFILCIFCCVTFKSLPRPSLFAPFVALVPLPPRAPPVPLFGSGPWTCSPRLPVPWLSSPKPRQSFRDAQGRSVPHRLATWPMIFTNSTYMSLPHMSPIPQRATSSPGLSWRPKSPLRVWPPFVSARLRHFLPGNLLLALSGRPMPPSLLELN